MDLRSFVAVGDSLTEGKGDSYPDGEPRGFADLLAAALPAGSTYANLARPSVKAAEIGRDQVPELASLAPHLVTVIGGINDIISLRFDAPKVQAEVAALLVSVHDAAPDALVITALLPDLGHLSRLARLLGDRVSAVNQVISDVAPGLGIRVVDLTGGQPLRSSELALDRVHPSPQGHLRFAAAIASEIGLSMVTPTYTATPPRARALLRAARTVAVAPRFVARRVARDRFITARNPKRPQLDTL